MEGRKTVQVAAEMSCEGCSGAITRILSKVPGVADINCSIPEQRVSFTADIGLDPEVVMAKLRVWGEAAGKQVNLIA